MSTYRTIETRSATPNTHQQGTQQIVPYPSSLTAAIPPYNNDQSDGKHISIRLSSMIPAMPSHNKRIRGHHGHVIMRLHVGVCVSSSKSRGVGRLTHDCFSRHTSKTDSSDVHDRRDHRPSSSRRIVSPFTLLVLALAFTPLTLSTKESPLLDYSK